MGVGVSAAGAVGPAKAASRASALRTAALVAVP